MLHKRFRIFTNLRRHPRTTPLWNLRLCTHKTSRICEQAATCCQLCREELANGRGAIVERLVVKVKKLPIRRVTREACLRYPKHRQSYERTNPLGSIFVSMLDFCRANGAYSNLVVGTDVNGSVRESNG